MQIYLLCCFIFISLFCLYSCDYSYSMYNRCKIIKESMEPDLMLKYLDSLCEIYNDDCYEKNYQFVNYGSITECYQYTNNSMRYLMGFIFSIVILIKIIHDSMKSNGYHISNNFRLVR